MPTQEMHRRKKAPVERKSRFSTSVDDEAMEFIRAIEHYKAEKQRSFPSWTEVLQIVKALGYRKVAMAGEIGEPEHDDNEED